MTHILSLDIVRKWIPSNIIFYLCRNSNLYPTSPITYEPRRYLLDHRLLGKWIYLNFVYQWIASLNVFEVFGRRSATFLYILYIVGRGRARRAPEFMKSLITNSDPPPPSPTHLDPNSEIENGRQKCTFSLYY